MVNKLGNILNDMHKGKDGRYSQRSILATLGYIGHAWMCAFTCYKMPELAPAVIGINAGLLAGLLALKNWQNTVEYKADKNSQPD